jgi:hypothetical protein
VVSNELEGPNVPAIFHQGDMEDAEDIFLTETEKSGITVGHEGLWTMNGIVPMVPPGTGVLGETCSPMKDGGVGSPAFYYPTLLVNVTSRYRLAVEPSATVEAGTRLTVTSVGGNCPQPAAAPEVSLYSASDLSLSEGSIPLVGSSAPWKSLLTVPKGLKPGRYRLEADCVEHYAVFGSYTPVVIMVR